MIAQLYKKEHMQKRIQPKFMLEAKTYSSGDSLVVTHPTTSPPIHSLSISEQTGTGVFCDLWPYATEIGDKVYYYCISSAKYWQHIQLAVFEDEQAVPSLAQLRLSHSSGCSAFAHLYFLLLLLPLSIRSVTPSPIFRP